MNIGWSNYLRWQSVIDLSPESNPERIQNAMTLIEATLPEYEGKHPEQPPKVHITSIKDKKVTITATVWYYPADNKAFLKWSQRINFKILRDLKNSCVTFAA